MKIALESMLETARCQIDSLKLRILELQRENVQLRAERTFSVRQEVEVARVRDAEQCRVGAPRRAAERGACLRVPDPRAEAVADVRSPRLHRPDYLGWLLSFISVAAIIGTVTHVIAPRWPAGVIGGILGTVCVGTGVYAMDEWRRRMR